MNRKWGILIAGVILLAVFLFWYRDYMSVDKCLDNGGRWNYKRKACENNDL